MSKMNDMAMTIEELRNAATAINDAANCSHSSFHLMISSKLKILLLDLKRKQNLH